MYTKEKKISVLIVTNMGATTEKPHSGSFVRNQVEELSKSSELDVEYYEMPDFNLSGKMRSILRYPLFALKFIWLYVFSKKKFDIVHIHFYFPTILVALIYQILRNPKCKFVVTFHGSDIYSYTPPSRLYKWCLKRINYFVFVSKELRTRLYKCAPSKVISAGFLNVYKQENCQKCYDLLFVGNLDYNKGVDRLLAFLNSYPSPLSIAVAGIGDMSNAISQFSGKHKIYLLGALDANQLNKAYNSARYLINLSRNESFGLVMTEAMFCGVPVICTNTDGSAAQINHNSNGYVVKQHNENFEQRLIQLVQHALSIPDETYNMLSAKAQLSAAPHKLDNICKALISIYKEVTEKHS